MLDEVAALGSSTLCIFEQLVLPTSPTKRPPILPNDTKTALNFRSPKFIRRFVDLIFYSKVYQNGNDH